MHFLFLSKWFSISLFIFKRNSPFSVMNPHQFLVILQSAYYQCKKIKHFYTKNNKMDRTRSINSQDHCIALILNSNPTILSNLLKLQLPFIYLFPLTIFNLIIFAAVKPTFSAQIIIYFIFIYILEVSQKLFLVHIFIYVCIYNIHNTNTNILIMVKQIVLYFLQEVFFLIFYILYQQIHVY